MSVNEAREALNAAKEARQVALARVIDDVIKQFDFIVSLRERQYQEAMERERRKNSRPSSGVDG